MSKIAARHFLLGGCLFFAVFVSLVQISILSTLPFYPKGVEEITAINRRFEPLKKMLPTGEIVSYVSDVEGADLSIGSIYHARYALAPTVISKDSNHTLVIGNFKYAGNADEAFKRLELEVICRFDDGVFLLRRRNR